MSGSTESEAGAVSQQADDVVDITRVELENEVARLRRQVAELEVQLPPAPPQDRVRAVLTWILVALTVLSITAAAVAVWTRETVFDTDAFMAAVQPALESPEVATALSVRLTDETLEALALEDRLTTALGEVGDTIGGALADTLDLSPTQQARIRGLPLPGLEQLAAPIAAGLETRIADRIDAMVTAETFRTQLTALTRQAHTRAVALVREDYEQLPNLVIESGEVRLDLVPVVATILRDLADQGLDAVGIEDVPFIEPSGDPDVALDRLSQALGVELDENFGKLVVMSQAELEEIQAGARQADRLVWALILLSVVLVAVTVAVARNRRRGLIMVSVGAAIAVTIAMLLIRNTQDQIASVAETPQGEGAIRTLASSTFDSLRTVMVVVLVVSLVVALAAYLLGRPAWLQRSVTRVRAVSRSKPGGSDLERFVADHHDPLRIAAVAIGVGVLALTGITLLSVIVVTLVVVAVLWGLAAARARAARVSVEVAAGPPESPDAGEV